MITALKTRLNTKHTTEEGFTLIELMVVVVIIGILAAISIPIFANQQKAAADAAVKSDLKNTSLQFHTYQATHGKFPSNGDTLEAIKVQLSPRSNYSPNANYFITCMNKQGFSLYGKSVSGNTFSYSSVTGKLTQYTDTFPITGDIVCPASGIDPVPFWYWDVQGSWLVH